MSVQTHGGTSTEAGGSQEEHLVLEGVVDVRDVGRLLERCRSLAQGARDVVVDLEAASHVDGAAAQVFLALRRELEAAGGTVRIRGARPEVRHSLVLAGLAEVVQGSG